MFLKVGKNTYLVHTATNLPSTSLNALTIRSHLASQSSRNANYSSPPPLRRTSATGQRTTTSTANQSDLCNRNSSNIKEEWSSLQLNHSPSLFAHEQRSMHELSPSRSTTPIRSSRTTPSPSRGPEPSTIHKNGSLHHSYATTLALHDTDLGLEKATEEGTFKSDSSRACPLAPYQRSYRSGFQPKGAIRHRSDEFFALRRRRRSAVELDEQRMERRLGKLLAIYSPEFAAHTEMPPASGLFEQGKSHLWDLFQSKEDAEWQRLRQCRRVAEQDVVKWQDDASSQNCAICRCV